jgi:NADPH2:quinone reductase
MRAVVSDSYSEPDGFILRDVPRPACGPGQVRVAVHTAGVSFVDRLIAAGRYQVKPPLPFIPGNEFAGLVEEAGKGVTAVAVGDRVAGSSFGGALAEAITVEASRLYRLPDAMTLPSAAVFRVPFATAYHALVQRGRLQAGETVLVLGAGGGVGYAAVQIATVLGARVFAAASTPAKRDAAIAAGAIGCVDAGAAGWRDALRALTGGAGIDVVVDPIGGAATETAFRCLGWGGRHLVIGFAAGMTALPTHLTLLKGASLIGVDLRQFGEREPDAAQANQEAVLALYQKGRLHPLIRTTYTLERFAEAIAALDDPLPGRVVIQVGD